jgi:hypothetical protein
MPGRVTGCGNMGMGTLGKALLACCLAIASPSDKLQESLNSGVPGCSCSSGWGIHTHQLTLVP